MKKEIKMHFSYDEINKCLKIFWLRCGKHLKMFSLLMLICEVQKDHSNRNHFMGYFYCKNHF